MPRATDRRSRRSRRSVHGGRHELGQNFLNHAPTIAKITQLVASTTGSILEIGAGGGAITKSLATLNRPVTAVELDENKVRHLKQTFPAITVVEADVLHYQIQSNCIVGNIPFSLTTPILRHVLNASSWETCILVVQWEVARKRAGVGGTTMMTAQAAPWYEFALAGRVPARCFTPSPSVDGGILHITRRKTPLVSLQDQSAYEQFVRAVFTGRGGTLTKIIGRVTNHDPATVRHALRAALISPHVLPRDLSAHQWATLWAQLKPRRP